MAYDNKTKVQLDAEKLISLRAKREWTQKTAAEKSRVSLPTYGNAERGNLIQLVKASRIAKAYRIPLEELRSA